MCVGVPVGYVGVFLEGFDPCGFDGVPVPGLGPSEVPVPRVGPSEVPVPGLGPSEVDGFPPEDTEGVPDEVDEPFGLPSEVVAGVPDGTDVFGEVFAGTPGDTCVIIDGPEVCPGVDVDAPVGCPPVSGRVYAGEVCRALAAGGACVVAGACFCTLVVAALGAAVAAGAGLCAAAGLCCCL